MTIPCHKSTLLALDFSHDKHTLATGGADKTVKLWSLASLLGSLSQREVASFPVSAKVRLVQFCPDDKALAIITEDGVLRLLRAVTLEEADAETQALGQ